MEVRDERVASVTDVVASDGELSVVSEYAEGLPLRAILSLASIRRKPMPVAVAVRFLCDLSDGVLALHRAMAELGDEAVPLFGGLSVDSVLMGANGRASLLDVSIASAATAVETLGSTPERIAYSAPEQVGAGGPADARTDVFSLGVMAWEMLSNRRLFVGSDKAVAQKVLAAKVPKLEDASRKGNLEVPKPLAAAVLRALAPDPQARFDSMTTFRAALDAAGVAPATAEEAASYIAAIADGALGRTRDALSLPPKPRASEAAPVRTEASQPRATIDPRPSATVPRASVELRQPKLPTRVGLTGRPGPARPKVEPKSTGTLARPTARPSGDPEPARPSIEPKAVATSRRVSIEPKPGDGWRALEAPPSVRSVPPANMRPRQTTMIGLPPPAGLGPEATPPARPAAPVKSSAAALPPPPLAIGAEIAPLSEPPVSSDGSDEPTGQYSREHLKQLNELRAPQPPSTRPPADTTAPGTAPAHATIPAPPESSDPPARRPDQTPFGPPVVLRTPPTSPARAPAPRATPESTAPKEVPLPRLVSLQPTPRPLSELHTERPPPPDPEPEPLPTPPTPHVPVAQDAARLAEAANAFDQATSSPHAQRFGLPRAAAALPPPSAEAEPVHVAGTPPPARVDASFGTARPSLAARIPERPAFSRPAPTTAPASYFPSQGVPPLIHDPRANRQASAVQRQAPQFTRGVLVGVVVSLCLVAVSAAVALFFMTGRDGKGAESEHGRARSDSLVAAPATAAITTATAASPAPAFPRATAAPSSRAAPATTDAPAASDEPSDDTAAENEGAGDSLQPGTTAAASVAAPMAPPARSPTRATRPARPSKKPPKKHGRFVPEDI
jgi:hypothetical protein